ncbi:Conserved protein of uncharacterised function%2C PPE family%2C PPE13 (part5) [Mycobacterium tuberculosis]|nr:Conserved protein of uncharacterised function%2C PPE family%2C PPE13 (part5) [Mycobacterium tuberculosis]COZ99652.1 Conserved protein of uncharacterised function%2C PPE family%2C PPE13 (part5) [Mycobacterium tuberculosis]
MGRFTSGLANTGTLQTSGVANSGDNSSGVFNTGDNQSGFFDWCPPQKKVGNSG